MAEVHVFNRVVSEYVLQEIASAIRSERGRDPSSQLGVSTGWSGRKEHQPTNACIHVTHLVIKSLVGLVIRNGHERCEVSSWGNYMGSGDHVNPHDHHLSHRKLGQPNVLAGVLFVESPKSTSPLVIEDEEHPIKAIPGRLVMFDARTMHWVPRVPPEGAPRLSLAFNIRLLSPPNSAK